MGAYDDLDELYAQKYFKEGNSRKVDVAIASIMDLCNSLDFSESKFLSAWQELLKMIILEYPNISTYNLASLDLTLGSRKLNQERLVICRFLVQLKPKSWEHQCFLGHAYSAVGDLETAKACYQKAYDLIDALITEEKLKLDHPYRLDSCDYLRHLADTERNLKQYPDALSHAALALHATCGKKTKIGEVYNTLYQICLDMGLPNLVEKYRLKVIESRNAPSD